MRWVAAFLTGISASSSLASGPTSRRAGSLCPRAGGSGARRSRSSSGVRLALSPLRLQSRRGLGSMLSSAGGKIASPGLREVPRLRPLRLRGRAALLLHGLLPGRDSQFIDLAILIMTYIMLGCGPEHRGRPRRSSGSRLRRVLRGRRLFLRAALDHFEFIGFWRHCRSPASSPPLGHDPRLPGPAAARRLPRDRDACLRRDHPRRAAELV